MNRRTFISDIAFGVAAALVAAKAQADSPSRIGFLPLGSPSNAYDRSNVEALGMIGEHLHMLVFTTRAGAVHVISLRR